MKCVICKHGETKPGIMTASFDHNGATIIIRGVPAEVCQTCGENYLAEDVSTKLLSQVRDAARNGVQVDIRQYLAA